MSTLHETQIGKGRKIAGYVLTILPSLMLLMSGIFKLIGSEEIEKNMSAIPNLLDSIFAIGLAEILAVVLYWIPKTSNIGFFLLASYGGGIILGEIISGQPPVTGIIITTMIYVGTMLRKPALSGLGI